MCIKMLEIFAVMLAVPLLMELIVLIIKKKL